MPAADADRAMRLDRHLDALLHDLEPGHGLVDGEMVTTLRHLHALSFRPVPDPAFAHRLRQDLTENVATQPRVILGNEGSRPRINHASDKPRSFAGAQNDTYVAHDVLPPSSLNGHAPRLAIGPGPLTRPWWQQWEVAAALLVIAVLGGYLAIANLGRTIPPPSRLSAITVQTERTAPARLRIGVIGVDALIEEFQPVPDDLATPWAGDIWATGWRDSEAVLISEPSDSESVAWLKDSAAPGEGGNVVLHGHLDSWNPGHAVFWNLRNLVDGDQIDLIGENNEVFTYAVEWSRRFPIDVDKEDQQAILGPTTTPSVTLVTSAGEFDETSGLYPEVLVVRANLVTSAGERIAGQPLRLRGEAIHLDALIAPRQPPDGSTLIRVGSELIANDVLDKEWILVQPGDTPSVVSWRDDVTLGEGSNVVLEGRRYVSWTKPAVFRSLNALSPGAHLELYGSGRTVATYEVEWVRQYPVAVDPRQRQDILGPTDTESLTLITDAGELDRATGTYPDILVVRARFIGSAPLPFLDTPDPAECTIEPRSVAEIAAAAATVLPEPRHRPEPTPLEGEPADAATIAAVIAAERKLVACLNANDPLRAYALYTSEGLEWLLDYTFPPSTPYDPFLEWDPDFSVLDVPATPLPDAYQLALLSVDSVRVLPDGRVAATSTIESGGPGMLGIPTGMPVVHVFVPGDRYLIDEFYVPMLME